MESPTHRRIDHCRAAGNASQSNHRRAVPWPRHQRGHLLQVEAEVWRLGSQRRPAHAPAGGREPQALHHIKPGQTGARHDGLEGTLGKNPEAQSATLCHDRSHLPLCALRPSSLPAYRLERFFFPCNTSRKAGRTPPCASACATAA